MIKLTKLNDEIIVVNSDKIQSIEMIPESKVILTNKEFFVVKEKPEDIIEKIINYSAMVATQSRKIIVETRAE